MDLIFPLSPSDCFRTLRILRFAFVFYPLVLA